MEWCHGGKVTKIPDSNLIQDRSTSRLSDPSITRNFPQLTGGLRAWCCNTLGRSALIRCLVWHGRRRWFPKICESMLRSNVFCRWIITFILQLTTEKYSVVKHRWINWKVFSCQTSSNHVISIQLANIMESSEKFSVGKHCRINWKGISNGVNWNIHVATDLFFSSSSTLRSLMQCLGSNDVWTLQRAECCGCDQIFVFSNCLESGTARCWFPGRLFAFLRWARHSWYMNSFSLSFVRYWFRQWINCYTTVCLMTSPQRGVLCSKFLVDRFVYTSRVTVPREFRVSSVL